MISKIRSVIRKLKWWIRKLKWWIGGENKWCKCFCPTCSYFKRCVADVRKTKI